MTSPVYDGYPTWPEPVEYGNINIATRQFARIRTAGGTTKIDPSSNVLSALAPTTYGPYLDNKLGQRVVAVLPLLSENGTKILSRQEAIDKFNQNGLHLGKFLPGKIQSTTNTGLVSIAEIYIEELLKIEQKELSRIESQRRSQSDAENYKVSSAEAHQITTDSVLSIFNIAGLLVEDQRTMAERLTSLSVSYSINMSTQVSASFVDPDYRLTENRYFDVRRDVIYRGNNFEIGSVSISAGPGGSPSVNIQCWPKNVQLMKRDKQPEAIAGTNGYEYAKAVARKYNMAFVGQKSGKQQAIFKGRNTTTDESVWTVLTSIGGDNQYMVFEVDNILVYGSMQWLMWRFGLSEKVSRKGKLQHFIELKYDPSLPNNGAGLQPIATVPFPDGADDLSVDANYTSSFVDNKVFELTTWPSITRSENDALEGDGSVSVASPNGKLIRPGHTVYITSVPDFFKGGYLVQDVSFSEFNNQPASVNFVTPQKPKDQDKPETT